MQRASYTTKQRSYILGYLKEHQDQIVTISEIEKYLVHEGMNTNFTTIYRYMEYLVENHFVHKYVARKGQQSTYQYIGQDTGCQHHLHMQCRECGSILHMDEKIMDTLRNYMDDCCGFQLECNDSVIYGTCKKCK